MSKVGPGNLRIELKSVRPSVDDDAVLKLRFFFEPVSGPPNVNFQRGNAKTSVKKSASTRHVAPN